MYTTAKDQNSEMVHIWFRMCYCYTCIL